ncbi:MAG: 30S ribosomal protein S16 [Gemmatimonadota bacterium]|nr:MAG: 30S ribosomal protein S16 [Gemmatimonadota bacterium]
MATRIRLRRVGRKGQASFRIVVAANMHSNSGRITETIGKYNPRSQPSHIEVDETRALYWLREGAQLSESVEPLFRKTGIMKKYAEGAEGAGVVVIGDPNAKTRPRAKIEIPEVEAPEPKAAEKKAKAKKAKAAKPAEAEAAAEAAPAEAAAAAQPAAEAPAGETQGEDAPAAEAEKKADES